LFTSIEVLDNGELDTESQELLNFTSSRPRDLRVFPLLELVEVPLEDLFPTSFEAEEEQIS
jgi:hypothetical protein